MRNKAAFVRHLVSCFCFAALIVSSAAAHGAVLLGTTVTGSINFDNSSNNYYDPTYGFVPTGDSNVAGTTVTIADPAVEFGLADVGHSALSADFTNMQLIISNQDTTFGLIYWTQKFTDTAFVSVTKVSDTFDNGGVTATLDGNTITLTWAGTNAQNKTFTAVFDINGTSAPEPSTFVLAVLAALMVGGLVARR